MHDPITITIPGTFDKRLTTNHRNKTYWGTIRTLSNDLHTRAALALQTQYPTNPPPHPIPLTIDWTIYHPKRQPRFDDDNIPPALKPARDAIATFLGIDDRHITTGHITQIPWGTHRSDPRIVATITPAGYWTRVPTHWLQTTGLTPPPPPEPEPP